MPYNQRDIPYLHTFNAGPLVEEGVVTLSGLKPNTRYWLWARAGMKGSTTDDPVEVRLKNRSERPPVVIEDSVGVREHQNISHYHNYAFSKLITTGSNITDTTNKTTAIELEAVTPNTSISDVYMTAIELTDLVEDIDYFYVESSTETDLTAGYQTFATKTLDLGTQGYQDGTWLVAGCSRIDINNLGAARVMTRLSVDHGTTTTSPEIVNGLEDSDEFVCGVIGRIFSFARSTATTASVSLECKAHRGLIGSTNTPDHEFTSLFGLKLSAFDYVYTDYDDAHTQTTSTSFTDTNASVVADSDTEDYDALVFGMSMFEGESTGRSIRWQINVDPSDDGSDEDVFESSQTWDRSHISQAVNPFFMIKPATIRAAGGDHTITLRYKKDSSAEYGVRDSGIASIRPRVSSEAYVWNGSVGDKNAETAANWTPTGTPGPRDRVIYNTGSTSCISGTLEVNSIHVAPGFSGTLGSGFTAGFKRMNISSPTATVKMSTKAIGAFVASLPKAPVIYFTSGSMEQNAAKLTATAPCHCVSNGTESRITLDGNFWERVVLSGRRVYEVTINGNTDSLTCLGTQRVTVNATVTDAYIYGPARLVLESGSKTTNAYLGNAGAQVKWKSDITNGSVYLYEGVFDISEATTAYSSAGLYVYDRAVLDTRTGFSGFNQPTVFQWWGGRNVRWLMDEGQVVTPS